MKLDRRSVQGLIRSVTFMNEANLQNRVILESQSRGLLHYHDYTYCGSTAGFPDLVIAGPRGVLYVELKLDRDDLNPAQMEWREMLIASGAEYRIWTPDDYWCGRIGRELDALMEDADIIELPEAA